MSETAAKPPASILLNRHHDISAFCVTDSSRAVIECVHYDAAHKRVEATNGHILIRVPVEVSHSYPGVETPEPQECCIPGKLLSGLFKALRKSKHDILNVLRLTTAPRNTDRPYDKNDISLSSISDNEVTNCTRMLVEDYKFPNTELAVASKESEIAKNNRREVLLGADNLFKIASYAKKHGDKQGKTAVKLMIGDSLDMVRFSISLGPKLCAEGAVMPIIAR